MMIRYPELRDQVISSIRSLSDRSHHAHQWGRVEEGVNYFDDLSLNIHILYDDSMVLPCPEDSVPDLLYASEVPALCALDLALAPMISDLGDATDEAYLQDPRWAHVIQAAAVALETMKRAEMGQDS